jgi:hypothetical protein
MKFFALFLIVLSATFWFGCSENQKSNTAIEQSTSAPILEINSEAIGEFDVTGKTLFFKLYENKIAEFEVVDAAKKEPYNNKAEFVNKKILVSIDDKYFEKLTNLIKSNDFVNLNTSYSRKCCCTDATINVEIKTLSETVKLENFCDYFELRQPTRYVELPKILNELFLLVESERAKPQVKNLSN